VLHDENLIAQRMLTLVRDGVIEAVDGSWCVWRPTPSACMATAPVPWPLRATSASALSRGRADHLLCGMSAMRFLPVNRQAILVELADLQQTLVLLRLAGQPIEGVQELVPAARTILVQFAPPYHRRRNWCGALPAAICSGSVQRSDVLVQIPVRYDGEDLAEVAQILGITPKRWCAATPAANGRWPSPALRRALPICRRRSHLQRAAPCHAAHQGACGCGGAGRHFSAVYPQASPGGWQIIGVTDAAMWDLARDLPALLQPGYRVQFVDAATKVAPAPIRFQMKSISRLRRHAQAAMADTGQRVCAPRVAHAVPGPGRHGQAGQGVSASGHGSGGVQERPTGWSAMPASCRCWRP
jgi:allophanate hydrolase subunit 1